MTTTVDHGGATEEEDAEATAQESAGELGEEGAPKRRRRGKRGGRRRGRKPASGELEGQNSTTEEGEPLLEADDSVVSDQEGFEIENNSDASEPQRNGDFAPPVLTGPEDSFGGAGEPDQLAHELQDGDGGQQIGTDDAHTGLASDQAEVFEYEPASLPQVADREPQARDTATGGTVLNEPAMNTVHDSAANGSDAELIHARLNEGPVNASEHGADDSSADTASFHRTDDNGGAKPSDEGQTRGLK